MKKILILTVTAGNGHNACARGMKNKLESLGDAEVKIVDLLKAYSTKRNVWIADRGYSFSVSKMLPVYNAFYERLKRLDPSTRYSCPPQRTVLTTLNGLLGEILSFRPDVVYCTHFYCAMALTDLALVYDLPCKTVSSNLDYVTSPFWEAGIGVDYFAIPNEDFIEESLYKGYKKEQLLPIGLPVDDRTLEVVDKKAARRTLKLDEDVFTIMVMFGGGYWSGGFRIFKQLINALKGRKAQILMINGKNKKGYRKIEKMKFDKNVKVVNVGFTNDVPSYLSAADVIINKFGGTSVTEMINKSLPMLIMENVAAQEKYNLAYMKNKGVALSFKNGRELKEKILKMMDDPSLLQEMSQNTLPLRKFSTRRLAEFMLELPNANYDAFSVGQAELPLVKKKVRAALKRADKAQKK